jgi:hypothetical protein
VSTVRRKKKRARQKLSRYREKMQFPPEPEAPIVAMAGPEEAAKFLAAALQQGQMIGTNIGGMDLAPETIAEIMALGDLSPSEKAFNERMDALGVPSFSQWIDKGGMQQVIDKAGLQGKPGAFILQQMINSQREEDESGRD